MVLYLKQRRTKDLYPGTYGQTIFPPTMAVAVKTSLNNIDSLATLGDEVRVISFLSLIGVQVPAGIQLRLVFRFRDESFSPRQDQQANGYGRHRSQAPTWIAHRSRADLQVTTRTELRCAHHDIGIIGPCASLIQNVVVRCGTVDLDEGRVNLVASKVLELGFNL